MKNLWMAATLALGTLAFASCSSDTQETDTTTATADVSTDVETAVAADTALTEEKHEFLGRAHSITTQQVELSKLALEKGTNDQVRDYAQQMLDIYNKKLGELQEISTKYKAPLPQQMEEEHAKRVQELRDAKSEDFNRSYWDIVVEAHKEALSDFEDNVKDIAETDNTTFNLWARNTGKEIRAQMENAMRFRQDNRN